MHIPFSVYAVLFLFGGVGRGESSGNGGVVERGGEGDLLG